MQDLRKEKLIPSVHLIKRKKRGAAPEKRKEENCCTNFAILKSFQSCNIIDQIGIILYFLVQANRAKQKHSDCQK